MEETELINRIKQGDKSALNTLIEDNYQAVFSYFYRNTGNYHQAKDLTQEVFTKVIININTYKKRTQFKNWLFTIASNHLKNFWRYTARHPFYELESQQAVEIAETEHQLIQKMDIQEAMRQINCDQKDAIILRFYHGFKIREIAKITNEKETTVKARIRYGLEKLKQILEGLER